MAKERPHINRIPINLAGLQIIPIEQYTVATYHPEPDGKGRPTQVHIILETREGPPIVFRLKTKESADILIAAIEYHRNNVWPCE